MPRSGTTLLFEAFTAHRHLAWPSQYLAKAPGRPALALLSRAADITPAMRRSVARSDQLRPWLERFRVGPSEAYPFWERCCGAKFRYDYLLGVEPTPGERDCVRSTVAKVLRYQGKPRFAAKITGPARIGYLSGIFPDSRFVHVVRDGRAVVQSLMRVAFWRERQRMREPAWRNGLTDEDHGDWDRAGGSPAALAAVQWRRVVESARQEAAVVAPDRYAEVHYERFVAEPEEVLADLAAFCGLPASPETGQFLSARFELRDMNFQWGERFTPDEIAMLNRLLGATLAELGYGVDPPGPPVGGGRVEQPLASASRRPAGGQAASGS